VELSVCMERCKILENRDRVISRGTVVLYFTKVNGSHDVASVLFNRSTNV